MVHYFSSLKKEMEKKNAKKQNVGANIHIKNIYDAVYFCK